MRTDIDRIMPNRPIYPFQLIHPIQPIISMDVAGPDAGDEWSDFVKDMESMPGTRMRPTKGRYVGWRAQRIEDRRMRADAAELAAAVAALCSMRSPSPPTVRRPVRRPVWDRTSPGTAPNTHTRDPVRRSARLADMEGGRNMVVPDEEPTCPGCYPVFQANQIGHMCPGGCIWTDEDGGGEEDGGSFGIR